MFDTPLTAVFFDGSEKTVSPSGASIIELERKYQVSFVALFQVPDALKYEHMAFLAWAEIQRRHRLGAETGDAPPPFDKWYERLDDVQFEDAPPKGP